jgi:hypothetical protein
METLGTQGSAQPELCLAAWTSGEVADISEGRKARGRFQRRCQRGWHSFADVFGEEGHTVAPPQDYVAKAPEDAEHEHGQDDDRQEVHVAASSCCASALPFSAIATNVLRTAPSLTAAQHPRDYDSLMQSAGGQWEPGSRRSLIECRRIGPVGPRLGA